MSSQAHRLVPVLVKIEHFSSQMGLVCAELGSFSTMNWISKGPPQTVCLTASLRSVKVPLNISC